MRKISILLLFMLILFMACQDRSPVFETVYKDTEVIDNSLNNYSSIIGGGLDGDNYYVSTSGVLWTRSRSLDDDALIGDVTWSRVTLPDLGALESSHSIANCTAFSIAGGTMYMGVLITLDDTDADPDNSYRFYSAVPAVNPTWTQENDALLTDDKQVINIWDLNSTLFIQVFDQTWDDGDAGTGPYSLYYDNAGTITTTGLENYKYPLTSMTFDDDAPVYYYAVSKTSIFRSADQTSFTDITATATYDSGTMNGSRKGFFGIYYTTGGNLYITSSEGLIYQATGGTIDFVDNGSTETYGISDSRVPFTSIVEFGSVVLAGTYKNGIYRVETSGGSFDVARIIDSGTSDLKSASVINFFGDETNTGATDDDYDHLMIGTLGDGLFRGLWDVGDDNWSYVWIHE